MTNELGTYLGMPIHHGCKKGRFSYLVERARMKLTGWKTKVLSRVTQTILIRSTLLTILIYAMQTVKLLTSAIQQLEKICRGLGFCG